MTGYMILFAYLFLMMVYDIRKREIHLPLSGAAALILSVRQIYLVCLGEVAVQHAFWGITVGIFIVVLSVLTRGGIGIGDGIIFMICGLLFGLYENSILLFLSLVFSAVASGVLIITKHVGRKYTLPFAPFVFAGYGVMCIWKVFG